VRLFSGVLDAAASSRDEKNNFTPEGTEITERAGTSFLCELCDLWGGFLKSPDCAPKLAAASRRSANSWRRVRLTK
jgi:hypothetical protein